MSAAKEIMKDEKQYDLPKSMVGFLNIEKSSPAQSLVTDLIRSDEETEV